MPKHTVKARDFYYWQHKDTGEVICVKAGLPQPAKADWVRVTKVEYDQWTVEKLGRLARGVPPST